MFAVVKIAGQQFKVEKDQTLYVPHIEGNAGDKVEFRSIAGRYRWKAFCWAMM